MIGSIHGLGQAGYAQALRSSFPWRSLGAAERISVVRGSSAHLYQEASGLICASCLCAASLSADLLYVTVPSARQLLLTVSKIRPPRGTSIAK
jgi:hypothetical protein